MTDKKTTNQEKKSLPPEMRNPKGKGGFGDNPQNRSDGRWKGENSQSYCLNMFLAMTEAEFLKWDASHPKTERTVAQQLAYSRIIQAKTKLPDYKEVVDRTEGQAKQVIENTSDDKALELLEKIIDSK